LKLRHVLQQPAKEGDQGAPPWEEGVTSMIGVKVAGSRERKKNKQHMKQYRAKGGFQRHRGERGRSGPGGGGCCGNGGGGGAGGRRCQKKIQEETDRGSGQKVTFNLIERLWIVLNKALLQMYKNKKIPPVNNK